MFKIVVLMKQTFDTEEKIEVINGVIQEEGAKFVINPYDEYALEEAVRVKEKFGAEVIVISVGAERNTQALRSALAVGADQAILIAEETQLDQSTSIAQLIVAAIAPMKADLILAGLFAIDTGSGSVALQVADLLNLPHASAALSIELGNHETLNVQYHLWKDQPLARVERDVEGNRETVLLPLPALISAQQGLNEPRYPSLPGIMKAKKKPLTELFPSRLLTATSIAAISSSITKQLAIVPPPSRGSGQMLSGTASEQASSLIQQLVQKGTISKGEVSS